MNGSGTAEERLTLWLQHEAAGHLPTAVLDAAFARTTGVRQARPTRQPTMRQRSTPALIAATLILVAAVIGGGGLMAGRVLPTEDTPSRTVAPSDVPTTSPQASVPTVQPVGLLPFTSKHHGYSLSYPSDWEVVPASSPAESDVFHAPSPSATRLSIGQRTKPASMPLDIFAEVNLPHRAKPDGCRWSSGILYIPTALQDFKRTTVVPGHEAVVREECGYVDAAVNLGDRVLLVVLASGTRRPDGDLYNFEKFAERLDIDPLWSRPSPSTDETTKTFVSRVYGYTIDHPSDWRATAATEDGQADRFENLRRGHLSISIADLPAGMDVLEWADRNVRDRAVTNGRHRHCEFRRAGVGFMAVEGPPPATFAMTTIAGHEIAIRSLCGFVDGVFPLEDRVLIVTFQSGRTTIDGNRTMFEQFVKTLRLPGP